MATSETRRVILAGWVATIGVLLTGVGEFLLHYAPAGFGDPATFEFLLQIPETRLIWGHFLAMLAVPSYLLGYWHLCQGLRPASALWSRIIFGVAAYIFIIASAWLGSRAWLAKVVQARAENPELDAVFAALIRDYHFFLECLLWLLRGGVLVLSGLLIWLVLSGRTAYPKWFAALSPIGLLILIFLTLWVPPVGLMLVPAAMNVAHVIFFGVSAVLLARAGEAFQATSPKER